MSYFKRFTDFCAGFTAFHAIIYLLGQFMSFNPADAEGIKEKLKLFLAKDAAKDHRAYVILIALLIFSVAVSLIFERLPYIGFAVSLLPISQILLMYVDKKLYEQPMLYVILGILHVSGNILYSLSLDKADKKRRAFICTTVFGVAIFSAALWLKKHTEELLMLEDDAISELGVKDKLILLETENSAHTILFKIGVIVLCTVLLSIILRDIYFIDVIASAVPFGYTLYLISFEKLTLFAPIALAVTFFYFVCRILLLTSEPMAKPFKFFNKS